MKPLNRNIIYNLVKRNFVWRLIKATPLKQSKIIQEERGKYEEKRWRERRSNLIEQSVKELFPELIVRYGVFTGMKYPTAKAVGSALFPKLIGSYERELAPIIELICQKKYATIVDIGCAEGYYAVGLAMRIPTAKVYAYDQKQEALHLCQQMAKLNQVDDRLVLGSFCDGEILTNIPYGGKSLIISDCEGYEKELFTEDVIEKLAHHDLLIEVHDCFDSSISGILRQRFGKTHAIEVIHSIDDNVKVATYSYPEIESYDQASKKMLLGEYRKTIMEWFYVKSLV